MNLFVHWTSHVFFQMIELNKYIEILAKQNREKKDLET